MSERIATPEAQMRTLERDLETIRPRWTEIDTVIVEQRGFRLAMRASGHTTPVSIGGLGGVVLTKWWHYR
jgi:hypothetical protein